MYPTSENKRRSGVYEVPCKDCSKTYIRETKVRFSEHKQAVKRGEPKNNMPVILLLLLLLLLLFITIIIIITMKIIL